MYLFVIFIAGNLVPMALFYVGQVALKVSEDIGS